jgi:hypothetical protein
VLENAFNHPYRFGAIDAWSTVVNFWFIFHTISLCSGIARPCNRPKLATKSKVFAKALFSPEKAANRFGKPKYGLQSIYHPSTIQF